MKLKSVLIGAASAVAFAATAMAADSITVVSWGGAYTKSQVEAYHKPWIAKTGNQVVSEDSMAVWLKSKHRSKPAT